MNKGSKLVVVPPQQCTHTSIKINGELEHPRIIMKIFEGKDKINERIGG